MPAFLKMIVDDYDKQRRSQRNRAEKGMSQGDMFFKSNQHPQD